MDEDHGLHVRLHHNFLSFSKKIPRQYVELKKLWKNKRTLAFQALNLGRLPHPTLPLLIHFLFLLQQ
jgi:hypothetical protein